MSHPNYVVFNYVKAASRNKVVVYENWAKEGGLDLHKPFMCLGFGTGFNGNTYKVARNVIGFSYVGQDVFDPYLPKPINLDDYL